MSVGSIKWPESAADAGDMLLELFVAMLDALEFKFPNSHPDPIAGATAYLNGALSPVEYRAQADGWWTFLFANDLMGNGPDPRAATARLALSLILLVPPDPPELDERLDQFLQLLEALGFGYDEPARLVNEWLQAKRP